MRVLLLLNKISQTSPKCVPVPIRTPRVQNDF